MRMDLTGIISPLLDLQTSILTERRVQLILDELEYEEGLYFFIPDYDN